MEARRDAAAVASSAETVERLVENLARVVHAPVNTECHGDRRPQGSRGQHGVRQASRRCPGDFRRGGQQGGPGDGVGDRPRAQKLLGQHRRGRGPLAGLGRLLETGRDVDGISRRKGLTLRRITRDEVYICNTLKCRPPGMRINLLPLYAWYALVAAIMIVFAFPPLDR